MINELQPYPSYKSSGVEWIGDVPAHWDVQRLKYLLQERDIRSADGREQLLSVSQYTGVTQRKRVDGGDAPDTRAQSLIGYKCVEHHDLVVNIMLAWNGSLGVSQFRGIAIPAYCVYRFLAGVNPWFFHYLLRSPIYKAYIKTVSTGVVDSRLRLYTDDLYRLMLLSHPSPNKPLSSAISTTPTNSSAVTSAAGAAHRTGWRNIGRLSSTTPSHAALTPMCVSSPPVSSGWAICLHIGR